MATGKNSYIYIRFQASGTFLKGDVDGLSYFHWFSVILFSIQNHPWSMLADIKRMMTHFYPIVYIFCRGVFTFMTSHFSGLVQSLQ